MREKDILSMFMNKAVVDILKTLTDEGFEVAIVGGAVRDILTKIKVSDWDLTTSAKPEEILKLFRNSFYNNRFGTVGVKAGKEIVEVTTYRREFKYSDSRHPDMVTWGETLEGDLARRDFTVNAIALKIGSRVKGLGSSQIKKNYTLDAIPYSLILIDPYNGQTDLKAKIIRTVGDSNARFGEDALRLI